MKNIMTKTTMREIKNSFGRWVAILAIVALGVGFFSGLKVCKADFLATGNQYTAQLNLYDFQLMTTLGLEDEDVEIIQAVEGVKAAEGTYSADAIIAFEDEEVGEAVVKFYTISDTINLLSVQAGTLPTAANEFAGDSTYFSEEDLGTVIRISTTNDEDTIDMFAYEEYVLTAIVDSPVYLNFERGSTSLGNGTVSCYIYLTEDGWDSDVYTAIYVDLDCDYDTFSDEYDEYASIMESRLETALALCAQRRYESVVGDAQQKLDDAKQELADAENDLEQYQQELDDAKQELADGESDLAAARQELADGQTQLAEARQELADGQEQIEQAKAELEDALQAYEDGVASYESEKEAAYLQLQMALAYGALDQEAYAAAVAEADQQFEAAWAQLEAARIQLEEGYAQLADQEAQLADASAQLLEKEAELADGYAKIADGQAELVEGEAKIADAEAELADGEEQIADAKAELEDAQQEIDDIEYPTTYVLGHDSNIGCVCFESDAAIVDGIAKVFPIFFFMVAAMVCITTMTRMIDEQRTQIGVLKALGYSRRQILGKYTFYSGSAALIGATLGFAIGTHLFPWVIWTVYGMMYGFADIIFVPDWSLCILSVAVALLCSVGTTLFSCISELREVPAQMIRPKTPKSGKRIFLEYIPIIWNKLGFLLKVSIRNTFRYKKRFFMMVLGISGCTALLITGLGVKDSIANVVTMQYDEIYHIDYTVSFKSDMDEDMQAEFVRETEAVASAYLFLYTGSVDAKANGTTKSINLVVCNESDDTSQFIDLHSGDTPIDYPGLDEGVINTNLAKLMGLSLGDTITVYDSDMREMTVTITALCDNYVYNYLYISDDTYEKNWGTPEINSAFLLGVDEDYDSSVANASDPHTAGTVIMDAENVSSVSITQDFRDRISNMMQSLNYIVILVVVCAGALAFIVLYNLTNINITERIREIATIKVLGFYANETASYVFRENIILTGISALVGMPLGKALHAFVISQVKIDMLSFDVRITALSYCIGFFTTFVFAFIVNLVMQHKLQNISMTESLKSIE